jgi:5-methylcytosine-specific restriction endonuclease McrA
MVFVKRFKSNGQPLVNMQCFNCGERDSKAYKIDKSTFDSLPLFNENLLQLFYENKKNQSIIKRQQEKNIWFDNYNEYLKSEQWRQKRRLVLKRDNFTCQSCLIKEATEVHHLRYTHVFNEPLFDLTSVCYTCHKLITELDRKLTNEK